MAERGARPAMIFCGARDTDIADPPRRSWRRALDLALTAIGVIAAGAAIGFGLAAG